MCSSLAEARQVLLRPADWRKKPAPAYSALRTDDVASDGGTFGFGEFIFTSDADFELNVWSAVNRSVLFNAKVHLV